MFIILCLDGYILQSQFLCDAFKARKCKGRTEDKIFVLYSRVATLVGQCAAVGIVSTVIIAFLIVPGNHRSGSHFHALLMISFMHMHVGVATPFTYQVKAI